MTRSLPGDDAMKGEDLLRGCGFVEIWVQRFFQDEGGSKRSSIVRKLPGITHFCPVLSRGRGKGWETLRTLTQLEHIRTPYDLTDPEMPGDRSCIQNTKPLGHSIVPERLGVFV